MPIGVGPFSEDAQLLKKMPGEYTRTGYEPGTVEEIPIRVVTTPPYFRGIFSEEREPTEADFRISGRLIFFVEPDVDVDTIHISDTEPSLEDIIVYNGRRWMVESIWEAGVEGHTEVLCQRQPRE